MIKVFGHRDGFIEVDGDEKRRLDCCGKDILITFADTTVVRIGSQKQGLHVWYIFVEQQGSAVQSLQYCFDAQKEVNSDVFTIDAEIADFTVIEPLTTEEMYGRLLAITDKASTAYYDDDAPVMNDCDYDGLTRQIKAIERKYSELVSAKSPTQKVGGTASKSSFAKMEHVVPMLSLQDVFSEKEVMDFLAQYPSETFSVEEKIDGLSMSVTYKDGVLVRAETRGDGHIGEDITENAKHIDGIPLSIKNIFGSENISLLEVRCEVYMPVKEFLRLNAEKEKRGEKLFANPRNAAAGMLRTKDIATVKNAKLSAFAFQVQRYETLDKSTDVRFEEQIASLDCLQSMGFQSVLHYRTKAAGVVDCVNLIGENKNNRPYWIDGAVIKIDSFGIRKSIGETTKCPKWAIAFKYPPEEKETVVKDIVLQTGRTGRVTPIAVLSPVFLAGTKVERATLNNPQFIKLLNIDIGDTVVVRKAAEIIPEIIRVSKKASGGQCYDMIAHPCPSCGRPLLADYDGNGCYCVNEDCPAQVARKFEFFCSRDCMDIVGFGPAIIDKLIELGRLKTLPDIYRLKNHREEMAQLDGFGKRAVDKLLAAIESSKDRDIDRLIKALGMRGVGRHIGKLLASACKDMHSVTSLTFDDLLKFDGIGEESASVMCQHFADVSFLEVLGELQSLGVNMSSKSYQSASVSSAFAGMTFVITGTLPTMKREEAAALIEQNGGKVSGSVSKKTTYLLCGENAGSKLDKANALGVKVIAEDEFQGMLMS